jgi:hypothetical protein
VYVGVTVNVLVDVDVGVGVSVTVLVAVGLAVNVHVGVGDCVAGTVFVGVGVMVSRGVGDGSGVLRGRAVAVWVTMPPTIVLRGVHVTVGRNVERGVHVGEGVNGLCVGRDVVDGGRMITVVAVAGGFGVAIDASVVVG